MISRTTFIIFSILLSSCSSVSKEKDENLKQEAENLGSLEQMTIHPGEVRLITGKLLEGEIGGVILCKGEELPTYSLNGTLYAFWAESYFSSEEKYLCHLKHKNGLRPLAQFAIKLKTYPEELLNVDEKKVELSAKDLKRVQAEQAVLKKIYDAGKVVPLFKESFILPMKNFISSDYGKKRIFNNKKKTQHLGTDFKAFIGEKIFSSNSGTVVFTGDLFFSGNTVILDHGMGLFTIYGHLSKISTKPGLKIAKGTLIGLVGATGRVTGPHLHWGVKVHGNWVDGISLINSSKELEDKAGK